MSKRKARQQQLTATAALASRGKRKIVGALALLLCLSLAGGIVAQWRATRVATGMNAMLSPTPTPPPPSSPSKEYIYAGGRLIATEEPVIAQPTAPSAPSSLTTTVASSSQINLQWVDNSSDETNFKVERKLGATGTYAEVAILDAGINTYPDDSLSASTTYYYRVRAFNNAGDSGFSNEAGATTSATAPIAPSALAATAISSSKINLSWTDNSDNETGFKIERKAGAGGTYAEVHTVGAGITTFSNPDLTSGTQYFYRVRATNAVGDSAYSTEANATTGNNAPTIALSPTPSNPYPVAGSNVILTADASDSDGTVNQVEFFQGNMSLGGGTRRPAPSTLYDFTWSGVQAGTYTVTAKATDNIGAATTSPPISVMVNAPPTTSITTPVSGTLFTAPATITINANASDSNGGTISKVEFFQGAFKLGEDTSSPFQFPWINPAAGSYALTAKATDNNGETTTSAQVNITVTTPPTVALTAPVEAATFMSSPGVTISANASDSDGTVTKVQFFQGSTLLGDDSSSPYSFTWSGAANGDYALTAKAIDNLGITTTSSPINITVYGPVEGTRSLSLNGTSAYVEVPNSSSLNITGPITLEAWVKTNSSTATQSILERFAQYPAMNGGYVLRLQNGKVAFATNKNSADVYSDYIAGSTTVSTGVWHHVAGVFDGLQMRVYLDGVLDGSKASTWAPGTGTTNLMIGISGGQQYIYKFNGLIDEARITSGAVYSGNFSPSTNLLVDSNTKGLWKFDGHSLNDSSTNSNHGSLLGGSRFSTDVATLAAYHSLLLNGTSAYAEVPNSTSLNITGPITVEAWVKISASTGTHQRILSRFGQYPAMNGGYDLLINSSGKLVFGTHKNSADIESDYVFGSTTVSTGVWHHVAGVFDGSQLRVYLDGVLDASKASTLAPGTGTTNLMIGISGGQQYIQNFNGLIDEARISSGSLYTGNFTPQAHLSAVTGTAGIWKFDGQVGSDSSGNGNNALLYSGAAYSTIVP